MVKTGALFLMLKLYDKRVISIRKMKVNIGSALKTYTGFDINP